MSVYSSTVTLELLCANAGQSCCSASVKLDSRALHLRSDPETSPLSLLRRIAKPSCVETSCLCESTTLLSIQVLSLGGLNWRLRGWFQRANRVVAGSSVLAVFLTRVHIGVHIGLHIVKVSQQLHDEV